MGKRQPETSTLALADGTRLRVLRWPSATPVKDVVLIQHGVGEHAGRYQTYVDELAALPVDIWSFDARGHGHSDGARGHAAQGIRTLADDLAQVLAHVKQATGTQRLFLMGHSLGGAVVAQYATSRTPDPAIQAMVLSAPAMGIPRTMSVRIKLSIGKVLGSMLPGLTLPNGIPVETISSDAEEVKRYTGDPLVHNKISAGLGLSLVADAEALPAVAGRVTLPMLVFNGAADPVVDHNATRAFVKNAGSKDVTYREFAGARHEVHHETADKRAAMFNMMREWLLPRLSA